MSRPKVIIMDATRLGPRKATKGSRMTAEWPTRTEVYEFNGRRWVHVGTQHYENRR